MKKNKYYIYWKKENPTCWNCARLKKSKRIIHENTLDNPHGGCLSMSAPSFIDAIAGYVCDNYWFGDKPDKTEMLCGGLEHKFKR